MRLMKTKVKCLDDRKRHNLDDQVNKCHHWAPVTMDKSKILHKVPVLYELSDSKQKV